MSYAGPIAVDYGTASRTEGSAGLAPPSFGAEAVPTVAAEQQPSVAVRVSTPSTTLLLRYQQRWYWREPNLSGRSIPLLYHLVLGTYTTALTQRLTLNCGLTGGYGTLDYLSFVTYTLPSTSTSVPIAGFMKSATATGEVGLSYQASQRLTLGVGASGNRREILNQHVAMAGWGKAQSSSVSGRLTYTLSERTAALASLTGSLAEITPYPPVRSATALVGVNHQFAPTSRGTLSTGGAVFIPEDQQPSWFPFVNGSFTKVTGTEHRQTTWTVSSGYSAYVDTILGRVRANATLTADALIQLGTRWTAQAMVGGAIPTTSQPIGGRIPESFLNASLTFTRQLGTSAEFFFGTRHTLRMTHPNASPFEVIDRQSWAFVGLAVWFATADGTDGRWVR